MKLPNNEVTAYKTGVTDEFSCHVKAGAKIFNILSTLYSNKIRAVIRELSCNALDSHKEAGNPAPFTVHLPSALEPFFSVRDYGTGLSHEKVVTLYNTYGESTKDQSNDYVGALGIGSKSPFCYTDNFTVISIKDGEKNTYTAFKDERGEPKFAHMNRVETTECNGLEVKFAVNSSDHNAFVMECKQVFKWFSMVPEFSGQDIEIPTHDFVMENIVDGVHIRNSHYGITQTAVMANIAYPIDIPQSIEIPSHLKGIADTGTFVIHFENGQLDFLPSRETLSYIPMTVKAIVAKYQEIYDSIDSIIENTMNSVVTDYEKLREVRKLYSTSSVFQSVINGMVSQGKIPLMVSGLNDGRWSRSINTLYLNTSTIGVRSFYVAHNGQFCNNRIGTVTHDNQQEYHAVDIGHEELEFFYNDEGDKLSKMRLREYALNKNQRGIRCYVLTAGTYEEAVKAVGDAPVTKMSSLPKIVRTKSSTASGLKPAEVLTSKGSSWNTATPSHMDILKDDTEIKLYVELSAKTVVYNGEKIDKEAFENFVGKLRYNDIIDDYTVLYGARKVVMKSFEDDEMCINLFDYAKGKMEKIRHNTNESQRHCSDELGIDFKRILSELPAVKSPEIVKLKDLLKKGEELQKNAVDPYQFNIMASFLNIEKLKELDNSEKVVYSAYSDVVAKYPLLEFVEYPRYSGKERVEKFLAAIEEYVK